jgi:hypothetical protein
MNRGLMAALAVTLAAVWYVSGVEEDAAIESSAPAVERRRPVAATQANAGSEGAEVVIASAPVRAAADVGRDLFASHSFLPPVPKVTERRGPPPAPMAPPLPFRYQGRLMEEGRTTVFLAQGERILPARIGDLLNNQYRVEAVTASTITFIFEPLKQRQTLTIGSAP